MAFCRSSVLLASMLILECLGFGMVTGEKGLNDCDGDCNDCQPGFADTCFTSVTGDLKFMLNLDKMVAANISTAAVHDLCLALDDSLKCTSDIVDSDCGEDEGRGRFDSWILALRGAYDYVCGGPQHQQLTTLLRSVSCWSIDDFLLCMQENMGLTHIRDLLHTAIDDEECRQLHLETKICIQESTVGSCREQDDVLDVVWDMMTSFFAASHCRTVAGLPFGSSSGLQATPFFALLVAALLALKFVGK